MFDVYKGSGGRDGGSRTRTTTRTRTGAAGAPATSGSRRRDTTIVGTAGHLHPGGLWTDLYVTRDGVKKHLFRSRAKYYEPAGPVSWDVSMTAHRPELAGQGQEGRRRLINATYGTREELVVRVDGDHAADGHRQARGRRGPVRRRRDRHGGPGHPRAAAGERQPRRRRPAACRTRASWPTARTSTACRSRSSSTSRATCRSPAGRACRRSSRPGRL